jgi:branched-chain amino acid transport system permease protein
MLQFLANGLCTGSIYALVALGFGLIYSTTRVFHIAHGFIYTAAAYTVFALGTHGGAFRLLACALAVAASVLLSVLIEALVYRPLERRGATSGVLMISSFGTYVVGINLIAMLFGNEARVLRAGIDNTFHFGEVILTRMQLAQLGCGSIVFLLYWLFLRRTSLGRTCRAMADDSTLASVLGVRVEGARLVVFAIGSALAAVGAILSALDLGTDPHVGLPVVLASVVACVIGGLHRFLAPALGGLCLGVVQGLVVWKTSSQWATAVTFSVLILFLIFRPQGLLGQQHRLEEAR